MQKIFIQPQSILIYTIVIILLSVFFWGFNAVWKLTLDILFGRPSDALEQGFIRLADKLSKTYHIVELNKIVRSYLFDELNILHAGFALYSA